MITPKTKEAYKLFHDGSLALSQMEQNGLKIDMEYLEQSIKDIDKENRELEAELRRDEIFSIWRKVYGENSNLDSRTQLAHVLFMELKLPCYEWTSGGKSEDEEVRNKKKRPKVDKHTFENIDLPFVKKYNQLMEMKKAESTYLKGLLREVCDGYVHPSFNLHLVESFRSSCDGPNVQNQPNRNPRIAEIIRKCYLPHLGEQLVEVDIVGAEVRCGVAYSHDPMLIEYIKDESKDMHRDMAIECFLLKKSQITKQIRYTAKNMFVFPQFYGSVWFQCAPDLWEAAGKLALEDGPPLRDHLASKGIRELGDIEPQGFPERGTFAYHIKKIEKDFWGNRFRVYGQWKRDFWDEYLRTGEFSLLTGFLVRGIYRKNAVVNFPIQGAAFHWLLQVLIWLQRWLNKNKMKSKIITEIHDSLLLSCPPEETNIVIQKAKELLTERLPKHWSWINVPVKADVEIAEVDQAWFYKKKIAA